MTWQMQFKELKERNLDKVASPILTYRRDVLVTKIVENPVWKNYIAHTSHPHSKNTEPWHAIGERLNAAAICSGASTDLNINVYGLKAEAASWREQVMTETAEWIFKATPFLWSHEIEQLADSAPLPKHVVSPSLLAAPAMFWSRETCYVANEGLIETNWIAMQQIENGVEVVSDWCDVERRDGPVIRYGVLLTQIPFGATWPNDFSGHGEDQIESIGRLLKRCAFLASPYISRDTGRLPRHLRRQLERAGEPPEKTEEPIHVVKLRHAVKPPPKPNEQGEGVEWKHKWWVKGHYRAQWYPSEQAHKVIWIAPFLKGDPNLPLLEKIYTVVR